MDIKEEGVLCKKDVQAKENLLRKGKYFCVESPLCLHEAGKEGYLKQKKVKQVSEAKIKDVNMQRNENC